MTVNLMGRKLASIFLGPNSYTCEFVLITKGYYIVVKLKQNKTLAFVCNSNTQTLRLETVDADLG